MQRDIYLHKFLYVEPMHQGVSFFLKVVIAISLITSAMPKPGQAQTEQRIAAIVNDELISAYDLEARMKLVIVSTRLPNTLETRRRIVGQILRTLIEERLKLQEAKRQNISVSNREIRRAKTNIEEQNKLPKAGLDRMLKENRVPLRTIEEQLRSAIAWSKLLSRRLRPRITVGEEEINETLDRFKSRQGQMEYRLSEILLAVDGPEEESNIMRAADRFRKQINNGASFSAIARQFSQSATAAVGGDLGWLHESELSGDIRKLLPKLQRGLVSKPIKTITGYRLLALRESRKIAEANSQPITLDLRQIFLPFSASSKETDIKALINLATSVRDAATGCQDFELLAEELKSSRPPYLGRLALNDMSPSIRAIVRDISVGGISKPVKTPNGILLLMVCGREGGEGEIELPRREIIAERIIRQRLAMMARRYLRDIRLSAVIDIRV